MGDRSVRASAKRKKKDPSRLILDQSHHHSAILKAGHAGTGRGRPDIAHFSLLLALGSPLNKEGQLKCLVHTRDNHVITVNPRARLPRNTDRFTSLLEQLYEESVVPSSGPPLMSIVGKSLPKLLNEQSSDLVVALTTLGSLESMDTVAQELGQEKNPVVLVGGFATGHFSQGTIALSSKRYRIDSRSLEAWTVVGRAIYDYEKAVGLKRFK